MKLTPLVVFRVDSPNNRVTFTTSEIRLKLSTHNDISQDALLMSICQRLRCNTVTSTLRGGINQAGFTKGIIGFYANCGKYKSHVATLQFPKLFPLSNLIKEDTMEKTITLPEDKFERAVLLDKLLLEGWTVKYDHDDPSLATITKQDLNEGSSKPQILFG